MARRLVAGFSKGGSGGSSACVADVFAGLRLSVDGARREMACRAPVLGRVPGLGFSRWAVAGEERRISTARAQVGWGPMGRGLAQNLQVASSPTAVPETGWPRSVAGLVSAQQIVRGITSTVPRATGLNDFFVSFPDVDKDGKPMFPAVGSFQRASLDFLSKCETPHVAVFEQVAHGRQKNCGRSLSMTSISSGGFF